MGYRSTIGMGNMMNSDIDAANRQIRYNNAIERDNFKTNLLGEKNRLQGMKEQEQVEKAEDRGQEAGAIGKTVSDVGDLTRLGIKRYKQGQQVLGVAGRALGVSGAIPQGELDFASRTPLGAVGESVNRTNPINTLQFGSRESLASNARGPLSSSEALLPGGESDADVNAVLDFGENLSARRAQEAESAARSSAPITSPEGSGIADRVPEVSGSTEAAPQTLTEMREQSEASDLVKAGRGATVEPLSIPKEDLPDMPEASGLGTLGKGLAGLQAATGAYDLYEDATAKAGTWGKKKGYEKVGDISNIAGGLAGALELAGVGADATIVGAPVGAVLGGLGAVAGAVSFGADLYGDTKKEKQSDKGVATQQGVVNKMSAQGAPQTKQIAERSLGTTGAYVGGA